LEFRRETANGHLLSEHANELTVIGPCLFSVSLSIGLVVGNVLLQVGLLVCQTLFSVSLSIGPLSR
jgi:hypothetical protein